MSVSDEAVYFVSARTSKARTTQSRTFSFNQVFKFLDCFVAIAPRNDAALSILRDERRADARVHSFSSVSARTTEGRTTRSSNFQF